MTRDPTYRPRWSNCLFWALHQLHDEGGYVLIRKGHHAFPFHVLWSPDHVEVWSYEPLEPWNTLHAWLHWYAILPILFRGEVLRGDDWAVPQILDEEAL